MNLFVGFELGIQVHYLFVSLCQPVRPGEMRWGSVMWFEYSMQLQCQIRAPRESVSEACAEGNLGRVPAYEALSTTEPAILEMVGILALQLQQQVASRGLA